jgi:hypothetical protein
MSPTEKPVEEFPLKEPWPFDAPWDDEGASA